MNKTLSMQDATTPLLHPKTSLPRGAGSIQRRGRVWWMTYYNALGIRVQQNTRLENEQEAQRVLTETALETARERVRILERIHAGLYGHVKHDTGAGSRSRGKSVRGHAGNRRTKTGRTN